MQRNQPRQSDPQETRPFGAITGIALIFCMILSGCGVIATRETTPTQGEEVPASTPSEGQSDPTQSVRAPFSSRAESGEGLIISWSGYTNGYLPGQIDLVEVTLENQADLTWQETFCILLMDGRSPTVISTLMQQTYTLSPNTAYSEAIKILIPQTVEENAYGLSLVVQKPSGPLVDIVPIQVGEVEAIRESATQQDLEAAAAACPPQFGVDQLINQAIDLLTQSISIPAKDIELVSVEAYDFPDASLGVPVSGLFYAQVLTPGYIIHLQVGEDLYIYHAAVDRVVLAEAPIAADSYQTIEVAEANLAFEIPSSWRPANGNLIWVPEPDSDLKLGFSWQALQPPLEAESAFLPSPAQTLSSSEIASVLGNGRRWTMEVYGSSPGVGTPSPVVSVETHLIIVVIQDGQRIGYHLYSSAPTGQQLSIIEPFLEHMLESLRYISSPSG